MAIERIGAEETIIKMGPPQVPRKDLEAQPRTREENIKIASDTVTRIVDASPDFYRLSDGKTNLYARQEREPVQLAEQDGEYYRIIPIALTGSINQLIAKARFYDDCSRHGIDLSGRIGLDGEVIDTLMNTLYLLSRSQPEGAQAQ